MSLLLKSIHGLRFHGAAPRKGAWAWALLLLLSAASAQAQSSLGNVPVGGSPGLVVTNPATNQVYVTNGTESLTVINGATDAVNTVTLGSVPEAIAVNPVTNTVYLAVGSSVEVINGATNTVTTTVSVGSSPSAIAVNPVTNTVYVANSTDGSVKVIDGGSNTVKATVTVGTNPLAVAVNPLTNQVFVLNLSNVSIINGVSNTVTNTVSISTVPVAMAVNPVTNMVYVAITGGSGKVSVFNGANPPASATTVTVGSALEAIAVNPVTNQAYVAGAGGGVWEIDGSNDVAPVSGTPTTGNINGVGALAVNSVTNQIYVAFDATSSSGTVTVIDGATNSVTDSLAAGDSPYGMAVNPVTNRVYATNHGSGSVTVISGEIASISNNVGVGSNPHAAAVNPATNSIYVLNDGGNSVSVIDEATTSVTNTVEVGTNPSAVAVNPVTNMVYVANQGNDNVSVVDGASNSVTNTVTVGLAPNAVAVNPVTNQVYVANSGDNTVTVIDGANNVTNTVNVGSVPNAVAVNPVTNQVYVANSGGNTVTVIDGATHFTHAVTVGSAPNAVAVNPVTNQVYVTNGGSNTVSVIDGATLAVTSLAAGTDPSAVAVNPVTNMVYVANNGSGNVTVINGATSGSMASVAGTVAVDWVPDAVAVNQVTNQVFVTNSVTGTLSIIDGATQSLASVAVGSNPDAVVVNPQTNTVYVINNASSGTVSVINLNGSQAVSLPITINGSGTTDSLTVANGNLFETMNVSPSFTAMVTSAYSLLGAYMGLPSGIAGTNPPPTALYDWVDDGPSTTWTPTTPTSSAGSDPASFTVSLSGEPVGMHTLYLFAAYGNEGVPPEGTGVSPEISNLQGIPFMILPLATTTTVTADADPQISTGTVNFTATVALAVEPKVMESSGPSGTVSFFDGTTLLGTASVSQVSGTATYAATGLSIDNHTITAIYSGDTTYGHSSGTMTEQITATPASISVVTGGGQMATVGDPFTNALEVLVTDGNGYPIPGAAVTFAGTGLTFGSTGTAYANLNGQASITATPTQVGALTATATAGGVQTSFTETGVAVQPSNLTYTVNPAVYTVGSAIATNSPSSSGGEVVAYSISPPLPAGLTFDPANGHIGGTPAFPPTATASYTVTGTNSGGSTTATVSITVNDVAPSSLAYTVNPAVYTVGSAIATNSPSSSGGEVVSYSIAPSLLPSGLSFSTSTGQITGTPTTAAATASYTVTATNSGGSTTASVSITVNDVAPSSLAYTVNPAVYTKGSAIATNSPSSSGGKVVSYSIAPSLLPDGLNFSTSTGQITGTPTAVAATASYTVTATNTGGTTTASVSLTVNDVAPSSLAYGLNPAIYTKGVAIAPPNGPSSSGGTVVSYSIAPSLPSGLNFSTSTGQITGTPAAPAATASYTVTATNSGGSATASVSITVNDVAPSGLAYTVNPAVFTVGSAIATNSPSSGGGEVASYSIAPSLLPSGLSFSTSTGQITGTPSAPAATASYTVTATNSGGSTTASVSITVNDMAPSSLTYSVNPAVYTVGSAIATNSHSSSGGTVVSYSIAPSLPSGLDFSTSTGQITGTPTTPAATASYTVTATNSGGSTTASVSIAVNDVAPSSLAYTVNPAVYTRGSAIATNSPSSSGGKVVSYSIAPSLLPSGLTFSTSTGQITGTPTSLAGTASYTVTATNSGGATTASVSITVNDAAPSSLAYAVNPAVYTQGVAIATNSPSSSGGTVVSYTVSPALPAGLSLNAATGRITGTPTAVMATAGYTVTATNSGGATTASVLITVNAGAPARIVLSSGGGQAAMVGTAFASPLVVTVLDDSSAPVPNALVTFSGSGLAFASQTATTGSNGQASVTITPSGSGALTGSASAAGVATSAPFTETGLGAAASVTLTSSANPAPTGSQVTFTALVSGSQDAPTGSVGFYDGSTLLGTAPLVSGVATFSTSSLSVATHPMAAAYGGDGTYLAAASAVLSQEVAPLAVSVSLSDTVSLAADQVTYTATVTAASPTGSAAIMAAALAAAAPVPTGSVAFMDGATVLGTVPLANGVASLTVPLAEVGADAVTVSYAGNGTEGSGVSNPVSVSTSSPTVVLNPVSGPGVSLAVGGNASLQLMVNSVGTLNGPVALSVSGLPTGVTAVFSNPSPTVSGSPATVTVTFTATSNQGLFGLAGKSGPDRGAGAFLLCGLLFLPAARRRKRMGILMLALVLCSLGGLTACGGSNSAPAATAPQPGTYQVTINASAQGAAAASTTVPLTIK